jgi:CyaY protein
MTETEFHDQLDDFYNAIEDAVDDLDQDVDCEISGSVLTLSCPDGSSLIFSRQAASRELWLAARSGGFHFSWDGSQWYCQKESKSLEEILDAVCEDQIGATLDL